MPEKKQMQLKKKIMTLFAVVALIISSLATPIRASTQEAKTRTTNPSKNLLENPNFIYSDTATTIPSWDLGSIHNSGNYGFVSRTIQEEDAPFRHLSGSQNLKVAREGIGDGLQTNTGAETTTMSIAQKITTIPGATYEFSADFDRQIANNQIYMIAWNGVTPHGSSGIGNTSAVITGAHSHKLTFTARSAVTTVSFRAYGGRNNAILRINNASVHLQKPETNRITNHDTTLSGKAHPKAEVKAITDNAENGINKAYTGTADETGTYTIEIPVQEAGTHISVEQTLENQVSETEQIRVMDADPYETPTWEPFTSADTILRGTASLGAMVEVNVDGNTYKTDVKPDGSFAVDLETTRPAGTEISIVLKGDFEKTSLPINVTVAKSILEHATDLVTALFTDDTQTKLREGVDQAEITTAKNVTEQLAASAAKDELLAKIAIAQQIWDTPEEGMLTVSNFQLGSDRAVNATYTGNITAVSLFVNGLDKGKIAVRNQQISYYALDKIRNTSDKVELVSYDPRGMENDRKQINILTPAPTGSVLPTSFTVGKDSYIKGTTIGKVAKVGLKVNGIELGKVAVVEEAFSYYAFRKFAAADHVEVVAYAADNTVLDQKTVEVIDGSPTTGTITAKPFQLGSDRQVAGDVTGDVHRVALIVNGEERGQVATTNSTFSYYAMHLIRSTTDTAEVVAYDKNNKELARKTVTIKEANLTPAELTVNPFQLATAKYLTGTASETVVKIGLRIDGEDKSKVAVINGAYSYYAYKVITTQTQQVEVIGYNKAGEEVVTKAVVVTASH